MNVKGERKTRSAHPQKHCGSSVYGREKHDPGSWASAPEAPGGAGREPEKSPQAQVEASPRVSWRSAVGNHQSRYANCHTMQGRFQSISLKTNVRHPREVTRNFGVPHHVCRP